MNWIWLILALIVAGIIVTCAIKNATEYRDEVAQKQAYSQDKQIEDALQLLREFPTAAGKEEKK